MNFPTSIHEDILRAVGLDLELGTPQKTRKEPYFRGESFGLMVPGDSESGCPRIAENRFECSGGRIFIRETRFVKWHVREVFQGEVWYGGEGEL